MEKYSAPENEADRKAREARESDDIDRWDNQLERGNEISESDDRSGKFSEAEQLQRATDATFAEITSQIEEGSADIEQSESEAKARTVLASLNTEMDSQREALKQQIEQEDPYEVMSEKVISTLLSQVKRGRVGEYGLIDADIPPEAYRELVARTFNKLGLDNPLPKLDVVQKNLLGRDKHIPTVVTEAVTVSGQDAQIAVRRTWDPSRKSYSYRLGGGLMPSSEQ